MATPPTRVTRRTAPTSGSFGNGSSPIPAGAGTYNSRVPNGTSAPPPDIRTSSTAEYAVNPNETYNILIAQQLANAQPEARQAMYDVLTPAQKQSLAALGGDTVNNIMVSTGATGTIPGVTAADPGSGFNSPGSPNYLGVQGVVPGTGTTGTGTTTPTTTTPTTTTPTTVPGTVAAAKTALGILNTNLTNPQLGANGTYAPVDQAAGAGEILTGAGSQLVGSPHVTAQQVNQQTNPGTATVDPNTIGTNTPQMTGVQGTVSPDALVNAPGSPSAVNGVAETTTLPPEALVTLPQGVLSPEAIAQYAQTSLTPDMMVNAATGTLSPEAMVNAINFQASEAFNQAIEQAKTDAVNFPIDPRSTVQEQYRQLTDFAPGELPGWAKGAVTSANQLMARRGVTSSTMAGGEITGAILKAALPIAQQDAQMFATLQLKQFDAKQSATILKASHIANLDIQSAQFTQAAALQNAQATLQMDLTNLNNEQQARVTNAQSLVEVAINNTGLRQQTALANASANLQMDMKNMDVQSAAALQNAQTIVSTLLANTANRQQTSMYNADIANRFSQADTDRRMQAAITNANNFMQMDLTNLNNRQQEAVINTQARVQSMLSDQAAVNAAAQFNAQSTNQTQQFFASLSSNIEQFNASIGLDAGKFNANMDNIREQFNASNALVIEQSNVNYLRNINTINTAEQNRANLVNSQNIVQMKSEALQASLQLYRDSAAMTFQSGESALDRANRVALMEMQITATKDLQNDAQKSATGSAVGGLIGDVVGSVVKGGLSFLGGGSSGGSGFGGSFGSNVSNSGVGGSLGGGSGSFGVGGSFSGGTGMNW